MAAAPVRSATRASKRPVFILGCISCLGFLFAGEGGLFVMSLLFTAMMWLLEL